MKSSTAKFIPYGLRPLKQTERRLLLDFLKCVSEVGVSLSTFRYVGMGGTAFYDFHLMHRFAGIQSMVSLERDADIFPRCDFNRPFEFIELRNQTAADFLATDTSTRQTVYWFDYDDGIGPDIAADIISIGTRIALGGFAFVTVYADPPGALEKATSAQRLGYFQQQFGELSIGLSADDMENVNFPRTIHRILLNAFSHAFAVRSDGQFEPLFQVEYKDSSRMITVGGCFVHPSVAKAVNEKVKTAFPFLLRSHPYRIPHLNLTERERAVFDLAVTKSRRNSRQANSLKALGFKEAQIDAYREIIRYLPRYHESIV